MTIRRKPKRLPGDNPLLRRAYADALADALVSPEHGSLTEDFPLNIGQDYRAWLDEHGIDPDTGKMTLEGLAFFEQLVTVQNARNRAARGSPRARAGRPALPRKAGFKRLPSP